MSYQVLLAATLTVFTLQAAACDRFWLPRCQDPTTPGCSFSLQLAQSELWCGEDAQLDLQVQESTGEDLSAEQMMRAADIKVALRLPGGLLPLPPPTFAEDHLRIAIPKSALTIHTPAPGQLELSYAKTTLTAPLHYSCERRSFRQVALQRLGDIGLAGAPLKFAGLTQLSGSLSGLVFASATAAEPTKIQYRAYKLSFSPRGLMPGSTLTPPFDPKLSFNDILQLRVALEKPASPAKGYVYFTGPLTVISDGNVSHFANTEKDKFLRPLIAATGERSVVATCADGQLSVHGALTSGDDPASVPLDCSLRAMALGDITHNGNTQLLVAQAGGSAAIVNITLPTGMNNVAVMRSDDKELSVRLSQIDGPNGLIISALALADFNADQGTDVLVLRSLPPMGVQSQLGIIYKSPQNGAYEDWHQVHLTEDPQSSPTSILTQDIQSIDVGLLDDDQIPDLVIATRTEVRLYLGVAH